MTRCIAVDDAHDGIRCHIGSPQLASVFGLGTGNVIFDGPGRVEGFAFQQTEGDPGLRYTFRTASLGNLKMAPAFFHTGAFGRLRAAITPHLNARASLHHSLAEERGD